MLKNLNKIGKPVLISGIQPTGRLHLGNYLGALKNFVELQNSGKYDCYFFIADYHSLTEDFSARGGPASGWNPKEKSEQILNLAIDYLAANLDPKKSTIFTQSQISAHAELTWILNTIAPFGELRRMTQFKEKSVEQTENINVGLFDYPVLMAADILLYDSEYVPIGEDQLQHLELTRTLARKFNSQFGKTFVEPKPILTKASRLMSLNNPDKKMSKSDPTGCLFIDDAPLVIKEKIQTAITDSGCEIKYNPQNKKAISNLLIIYSALSDKPLEAIEKEFHGKGYFEFKKSLAQLVIDYFGPFRKKKAALAKKVPQVKKILKNGNAKAKRIAEKKILEIKRQLGLII